MQINSVTLRTAAHTREFQFGPGVTLLSGPVGTGKSSLLELIKFALGGDGEIKPTVRKFSRRVSIDILMAESHLVLGRDVGSNTIDVTDAVTGDRLATWSARKSKLLPLASEQLLKTLGLPALRMPRSRKNPATPTVPLSFFDIYRYVYVRQAEIDDSVVRHTDHFVDPKRRAVFEILYGLTDEDALKLEVEKGQKADRQVDLRREANTILNFLQDQGEPNDEQLSVRKAESRETLESAKRRLAEIRADVNARTRDQDEIRREVSLLRRQASEAATQRDAMQAEVERGRALVAQLRVDEGKLLREGSAHSLLDGIDFVACPRCLQALSDRPNRRDSCYLCLQHIERPSIDETADDKALTRLREQLAEAESLLQEDMQLLADAEKKADDFRILLDLKVEELNTQIRDAVSPALSEVERLSALAADAEATLRAIEQSQSRWQKYHGLMDEIAMLTDGIADLERQRLEVLATLQENRVHLREFSKTFDDTVKGLGLPWYENAHIDEDTFLPMVNRQSFGDLSVAGARKTLVTVAYHLANLTYAAANDSILMPSLLIIDTPRKGIGAGDQDSKTGQNVYDRISRLIDAYGDKVQIIVADNDTPRKMDSRFRLTTFSYPEPLILDVAHPGGGAVETVGGKSQSHVRP